MDSVGIPMRFDPRFRQQLFKWVQVFLQHEIHRPLARIKPALPMGEIWCQYILDRFLVQGIFDHGFFGHWLEMPPVGLGDGQKAMLGNGRR